MRPKGSPKWLEERRRSVVAFLKQNLSLHEIARRMGCHASSVLRWRNTLRSGGPDALKAKPAAGRPPRLTSKQKARLVRLLAKGAMAHGLTYVCQDPIQFAKRHHASSINRLARATPCSIEFP